MKWNPFRRRRPIGPSPEALAAREELHELRERVDQVTTRRDEVTTESRRLLEENHFAARIKRLYTEGA